MIETQLSEDEELLRDTAGKFGESVCPLTTVRALIDSETGLPPDYLRQVGDLGWFGLLVGEDGPGAPAAFAPDGVRYLALVAEQRGRGLQPGPFVPMNIAVAALCRGGSPAQGSEVLPALIGGEQMATWVVADPDAGWDPRGSVSAVGADGGAWVLSGQGFAQDGALADWLLVAADGPDGVTQFLVPASSPGVRVQPLTAHDVTRRFARVSFDGVRTDPSQVVGAAGAAADDLEYQLDLASVLTVAESVGAMDVLLEMARQYSLDRFAFGRPIGSFQALKHQIADLSLAVESGKAVSVSATEALAAGRPDAGEIASMAKAWVGDGGIDVAQGCFQVFGGIGYTWEHDSHLYLRRITMNSALFGGADWHRERICTIHGI